MLIFVVFECLQVMTIALLIINDILKKMPGLLYPKGEEKKKKKENQSEPIATYPLVTFLPQDCLCVLLINTAWKIMGLSDVLLS